MSETTARRILLVEVSVPGVAPENGECAGIQHACGRCPAIILHRCYPSHPGNHAGNRLVRKAEAYRNLRQSTGYVLQIALERFHVLAYLPLSIAAEIRFAEIARLKRCVFVDC